MKTKTFGVDFDTTLRWVQKKNPNMSYADAERFAANIIRKRECKELTEKTSNVPNVDGRPLRKRFEIVRFRHISGYIVTDVGDHQTKKAYGHSWKTLAQAEKWLTDLLGYIVKNIPTNGNLFIENNNERPKLGGHRDIFERGFTFE